jgi:23S rRNA (cytosine1962-C5)-methyltransferase
MAVIRLKPGREKSVRNRHPWVFTGAIAGMRGPRPQGGEIVDVVDAGDAFLARGYYNAASQIAVRLLTWNADEAIDEGFWRRRIEAALERRRRYPAAADSARRLVYAESDGLPGLVVDRYGEWLVLQSLTLGIEVRKEMLVGLLAGMAAPRGIYERSDADVRAHEGLDDAVGPLWGETPDDAVIIDEGGLRFRVDLLRGHKTGFYLDQRENRRRVAAYCDDGAEVLNVFSYTGGFAVYAAAAGAGRVTNLDSSADALAAARENARLNGLEREDDEYVAGDAFQVLRGYRDRGRQFDVIVLDPPKFAFSRAQVQAATRGYKDINMMAMRLLRPGGTLCTFSCSGLVSEDLFQKVLFGASVDAGREVRILERLGQGSDHPVLLTFPEAAYLKGFICRVE